MITCPVCWTENLDASPYCEDCGAKLDGGRAAAAGGVPEGEAKAPPQPSSAGGSPLICPSCGGSNAARSLYCGECGAGLAADRSAPPAPSPAGVAAVAHAASLTVKGTDHRFALAAEVTTIGRASPADGVFPDIDLTADDPNAFVSRRHGQVVAAQDGYALEDLGSTNGSFVNDARVGKGAGTPLKDGDTVRIGKTVLVFNQGGDLS